VSGIDEFFADASRELARAIERYPSLHSAHEGESVLREEFDELVAWVRRKPAARDAMAMRAECVQIAAMAARFALDLCESGRANEV
jgi:hypothetical protein